MLQSLKRAHAIDPTNPTLHNCVIRFFKILESKTAGNELEETVKMVIDRERVKLFGESKSAAAINDGYLAANRDNAEARYVVAKVMYQLNEKRQDEAIKLLTSADLKTVTLEDATKVLLLLKSNFFGSVTEEQIDAFKKSCQKRFPLAVVFADVASTIATLTTTQSSSPTSSATVTTSATGMTMCPVEQQSKTSQQQQNKGSEIKAN